MKTKLLSLSFVAAAVITILLRIIEMLYFIDPSTGFYYSGLTPFAFITVFFLLLFVVLDFLLVTINKPKYKSAGELYISNVVGALICLAGFLCDLIIKLCSPAGASTLQIIFSLMMIAFFAALTAYGIAGKAIMPILCFLPLPYWIYLLIRFFIEITDMAVISENLYRLAALSLMLICYSLLAKVMCHVNLRKNARRLTVIGLATATVVGISNVSEYILILLKKSYVLHYSELPDVTLFLSAIFMVIYILTLNRQDNITANSKSTTAPAQDA